MININLLQIQCLPLKHNMTADLYGSQHGNQTIFVDSAKKMYNYNKYYKFSFAVIIQNTFISNDKNIAVF